MCGSGCVTQACKIKMYDRKCKLILFAAYDKKLCFWRIHSACQPIPKVIGDTAVFPRTAAYRQWIRRTATHRATRRYAITHNIHGTTCQSLQKIGPIGWYYYIEMPIVNTTPRRMQVEWQMSQSMTTRWEFVLRCITFRPKHLELVQ